MKMQKLGILGLTLTACLLATVSFASDRGSSATGPGPIDGEIVTPAPGVGACYFSYYIRKVGDQFADHDGNIRYRVLVKNIGDCELRHIDVTDFLPARTDFVSANPTPTRFVDHRLFWDDVQMWPGEQRFFDITVKARDHRPMVVTNTGCAYTPWIGIRICDSASTQVRLEDELQ